jgi:hypothetical protein
VPQHFIVCIDEVAADHLDGGARAKLALGGALRNRLEPLDDDLAADRRPRDFAEPPRRRTPIDSNVIREGDEDPIGDDREAKVGKAHVSLRGKANREGDLVERPHLRRRPNGRPFERDPLHLLVKGVADVENEPDVPWERVVDAQVHVERVYRWFSAEHSDDRYLDVRAL